MKTAPGSTTGYRVDCGGRELEQSTGRLELSTPASGDEVKATLAPR